MVLFFWIGKLKEAQKQIEKYKGKIYFSQKEEQIICIICLLSGIFYNCMNKIFFCWHLELIKESDVKMKDSVEKLEAIQSKFIFLQMSFGNHCIFIWSHKGQQIPQCHANIYYPVCCILVFFFVEELERAETDAKQYITRIASLEGNINSPL